MSSNTSNSSSSSPNPLSGGCPVAHDGKVPSVPVTASNNALAGGCPVAHNGVAPNASTTPAATTPTPHTTNGAAAAAAAAPNALAGGCPMAAREPAASSNLRPASSGTPAQFAAPAPQEFAKLDPEGEVIPPNAIPAAGRGNSEDGKSWLNPSANQLFRALMRKDKPIAPEDSQAVAHVHVAVTDNTWSCIMDYEALHKNECPNPTLSRFYGMDGVYSFKAQIYRRFFGLTPFDRHDWVVNRCGKEVKYIIDYYSIETPIPDQPGETHIDYFIDARPAPTFSGMVDRARLAFQKWKNGEKWF